MPKPAPLFTVALFLLAISALPADPARDQLAAARASKDTDAERELTLRLLDQTPNDPDLLRPLARIQLSTDEYERCAETLARLAAALDKPDAELLEMRGDLADTLATTPADRERAADFWQAALVLQPMRSSSLLRLANHHRRANNNPAEALYRQRLTKLRDRPDDHAALARIAVATRDWDTIFKHSTHLREHHANINIAKKWAATYDRLMESASRLAVLDARIKEAPTAIEPLLERAWLFDDIRIDELALADARRAHKLEPSSFAVKYQLAVAMAHSGETDAAREQFNIDADRYVYKHRRPNDAFFIRLSELEPLADKSDPTALAERSTLLRAEGQHPLALADAKRAVAEAPALASAQLALARCEADADHTAAAKAAYAAVLRNDANNIDALGELGLLHMKLGDYAEAAPLLARHIKLDPKQRLADQHARCFAALQKAQP